MLYNSKNSYALEYLDGTRSLERILFQGDRSNNDIVHTVLEDQTLQDIAYMYFDNPSKWVVLFDFNKLENPWDIVPGDKLVIPANHEY